jgi:hypothetical protein
MSKTKTRIKRDDFIDDLYGTTIGSAIVASWILSDKKYKHFTINKLFIQLVENGQLKDIKLSQVGDVVRLFGLNFDPEHLALVCRNGFALIVPFDGTTAYPLRTDRPANPILAKPDSVDCLKDILEGKDAK